MQSPPTEFSQIKLNVTISNRFLLLSINTVLKWHPDFCGSETVMLRVKKGGKLERHLAQRKLLLDGKWLVCVLTQHLMPEHREHDLQLSVWLLRAPLLTRPAALL